MFTNPNEACERYQYISLPLQPAKVSVQNSYKNCWKHPIKVIIVTQGSSMQRTGMGSIGTAVTGAAFFNDWSDPNGKVAMSFEVCSHLKLMSFLNWSYDAHTPLYLLPHSFSIYRIDPDLYNDKARSLDSCFGHSARQGSYHYHANINCTNAG